MTKVNIFKIIISFIFVLISIALGFIAAVMSAFGGGDLFISCTVLWGVISIILFMFQVYCIKTNNKIKGNILLTLIVLAPFIFYIVGELIYR